MVYFQSLSCQKIISLQSSQDQYLKYDGYCREKITGQIGWNIYLKKMNIETNQAEHTYELSLVV